MATEWGEIPAGAVEFSVQKQGERSKASGAHGWPSCEIADGTGAKVVRVAIDRFAELTDDLIVGAWGPGTYRIAFYCGAKRAPKFSKHRGLSAKESAPAPAAPAPAPAAAGGDPLLAALSSAGPGGLNPLQMMLLLEDRISRRYEGIMQRHAVDAHTQVTIAREQAAAQVRMAHEAASAEVKRQETFFAALLKAQKGGEREDDGIGDVMDRLDELEEKIDRPGASPGGGDAPPLELSTPDGKWNVPAIVNLIAKNAESIPHVIEGLRALVAPSKPAAAATLPAAGGAAASAPVA